jgi:tRNA(fMet)-specific endonuclease VapC
MNQHSSSKLRVTLRLEAQDSGRVAASVVEFPDCRVEAATREEAIEKIQAAFLEQLARSETISWDVPLPSNKDLNGFERRTESPWIKYAGMFKDDPDFAEIAAAIRAEREVEDDTEVDPSVYSLEGWARNLYILDTDHVSLWLEDHPVVRNKAAEFEADLAITIVTLQELFNGWVGRPNNTAQANQQVRLYAKLSKIVAYLQEVKVLDLDDVADCCFRQMLTDHPNLRKNRIQKDVRIAGIALRRSNGTRLLACGFNAWDWLEPKETAADQLYCESEQPGVDSLYVVCR